MKKNPNTFIATILTITFLTTLSVFAQSSGGSYAVTQSVIANGGGTSSGSGNIYKVEGTNGESLAGAASTNGSYNVRSGFWALETYAPTAAAAFVSGQVVNTNGMGIKNTSVSLSGGNLFAPRVALTNAFGYFSFENVDVGQVYVISVKHKKYGFAQPMQVVSVSDNIANIVFQADWEK